MLQLQQVEWRHASDYTLYKRQNHSRTRPADARPAEHLLAVARRLQTSPLPPGTPGKVLLQIIEGFEFEPEDLEEMSRAIEEDCEQINPESFSDGAT